MTKTYSITDVHGMHDLLVRALSWIAEDSAGEPHTVVFHGDYVDRGPSSKDVVQTLIDGPPDTAKWVILTGNHEQMMLWALSKNANEEGWQEAGGKETMESYARSDDPAEVDASVLVEHLLFLSDLDHFHEDAYRVYVHAAVADGVPLEEQSVEMLCWTRYTNHDAGFYGSRHVVHGHTPHHQPVLKEGRTNLDTGACETGRLSVGVFEDDTPGGPVAIAIIE